MYKQDLALDNLQGLICYKTQPTNLLVQGVILSVKVIIAGNEIGCRS